MQLTEGMAGDDGERTEIVYRYGLHGMAPEPALEELVRLASQICRTPLVTLSLVDERREWMIASHGWRVREVPRAHSLAAYTLRRPRSGAVTGDDLVILSDLQSVQEFEHNPHVAGEPHLRFYAGVPLLTPEGVAVGVFAVQDTTPRLLDWHQAATLGALARQAMALLDLHRQVRELENVVNTRVHAEESVRWQASHDALTGLPNRSTFHARVRETIEAFRRQDEAEGKAGRKARRGARAAVLFVDLDRFKRINDTMGHAYGDMLLREVAARFAGCLRPEDLLARFAGDEFVVLLPQVSSGSHATSVAQMLLRALSRPIVLGAEEIHVSASIGIAFFPRDGQDADLLLKHADIAMYQAKVSGGYQIYARRMNADGYQRLVEEGDLRRAIDREELDVCFQPQVDLATGSFFGVEALCRWEHPGRGPVPPDHFIRLAEQADLIVPLGDLVLRRACQAAAQWRADGFTDLRVAVNLSPRQLAQSHLVQKVADTLRETGLTGDALDLELTETTIATVSESTPRILQDLRAMGIRVLVDDFGTGYSSLAYLRRFAVDAIKIDRAFVAGLGKDATDDALVRTLIEMAHALRLLVVAEGVENRRQVELLRAMHCDVAQGFFFSRPLSLPSLRQLVERRGSRRLEVDSAAA